MQRMKNKTLYGSDKYKMKLTELPVSRNMSLHVIGTGAKNMGRSVLLRTASERYLFNCGETVQRCLIEPVIKTSYPIYNIFFTSNTWKNIGGLMGVMLTATANNELMQPVIYHGPPHADRILSFNKLFSEIDVRAETNVEWRDPKQGNFEDSQITVEYVILESSCCESTMSVPSASAMSVTPEEVVSLDEDKQLVDAELDVPEDGCEKATVIAYIVTPKQLPRKVDVDRLMELNEPSGPWVGRLVKGETVTLESGRVVKPEDVLFAESNTQPIVVLECPNLNFLDSLVASEQLLNLSTDESRFPEMIVHMSPCEVIDDPRYQSFMERFCKLDTVHLMLNERCVGPYTPTSHFMQSCLNHLHNDIFPLLLGHSECNTPPQKQDGRIIQAVFGLEYEFRGQKWKGFRWDDLPYTNIDKDLEKMKEKAHEAFLSMLRNVNEEPREPDYYAELASLKKKLSEIKSVNGQAPEYPQIVFLGTGSSKPGLERNVTSILVQTRKDNYMMLDCGEGTLSQMYILFGLEKTHHIMSCLDAVFISHLHYDHHGGLFSIIQARQQCVARDGHRVDSLLCLAPFEIKKWLNVCSRVLTDLNIGLEVVPHHVLYDSSKRQVPLPKLEMIKQALNLKEYLPVPVVHAPKSFGMVIRHNDGWKLVYSGDTKPSPKLNLYGKDCDYLIHEGTFHDDQLDHAIAKKHCTLSQAIDSGREMNAKYILLTHFSQRFCKIPLFTDKFTENVGFAFDFMMLKPCHLPLIPLFKPVLEAMYRHQVEAKLSKLTTFHKIDRQFCQGLLEQRVKNDEDCQKDLWKKDFETKKMWSPSAKGVREKLIKTERKFTDSKFVSEDIKGEKIGKTKQDKRKAENYQKINKIARTDGN